MISDKQLKANKENALQGGVKTPEGKEISKFNAMKHGILKQSLTDYESDFYVEIYNDLISQYQPVTLIENILLERISIYYLKLFRVEKAEAEHLKATLDPHVEKSKFPSPIDTDPLFQNEVVHEGYIPQLRSSDLEQLSTVYSRYEAMLENRLYRALHEFERFRNGNQTKE